MSKYECEVYDLCEGRVDLVIEALDADRAYEEARIGASGQIADISVYDVLLQIA